MLALKYAFLFIGLDMPIYAYRCDACGHACDVLQKISDPAPACEQCGYEVMSKQVTAASFELKGGGWYQTDFAGKSSCPAIPDGADKLPPCATGQGCCAGAAD